MPCVEFEVRGFEIEALGFSAHARVRVPEGG
jgi:hypothetical protein